ncbi:MAG: mechanosensitive ion channel, partial [Acidaminococcaceae bacterium]|nr:mechanosensitive ion channel [Acidaminococcaceae bacterium]
PLVRLLGEGMMGVVKAVLLLVLAYFIASAVRSMLKALLNKTSFCKSQEDGAKKESIVEYIGDIAYLFVMLLFVPGIFSALGASTIATPILDMMRSIWSFLPNLLGAGIVLMLGNLVAKLIRQLLAPALKKANVDKLQEKLGCETPSEVSLSETLAYLVYVLILIPVIIAALQVLKLDVLTAPATVMLQEILTYIPLVAAALFVAGLGVVLGRLVSQIVTRLIAASGADEKVKEFIGETSYKFSLSGIVGSILNGVIVILFTVQGVNLLKLEILTKVGTAIIGYLPNILAAVLVMAAAWIGSAAAQRAFEKNGFTCCAAFIRGLILIIAGFMILSQLGIAVSIVNEAFIIILTGAALAFAIAFGIGGADIVKKYLAKRALENCCAYKEEVKEEAAENETEQ